MMAMERYARLGLFVLVAIVVMAATALFFIERVRQRAVIPMVTYVSENVSGLDVASPVRFRGVPVGQVTDLRVDPSGNTIEIDFEVFQDRILSIGANLERLREQAGLAVVPRLRSRVVANPVTGEAYLLLDIPADPPPVPELSFTPKPHYVPSMPSPLAAVQDRLPDVLARAEETLQTVREIVARIPTSMERTDRFLNTVEGILRESDLPGLSADLRSFSAVATARMAEITSDIDRVMGHEGTLLALTEEARDALRDADIPASSQAGRQAAERTVLAADDLRRALPAMRETLEELRELARLLQEQPESIVYGPRQPEKKP